MRLPSRFSTFCCSLARVRADPRPGDGRHAGQRIESEGRTSRIRREHHQGPRQQEADQASRFRRQVRAQRRASAARAALASSPALSHKLPAYSGSRRRLLAACCYADLMRIYCPEAPYDLDTEKETLRVRRRAIEAPRSCCCAGLAELLPCWACVHGRCPCSQRAWACDAILLRANSPPDQRPPPPHSRSRARVSCRTSSS